VFSTTIASSVLILSIALVRRLFRGGLDLRLQYALWLLVAARLLLPLPPVQSPVSVLNVLDAGVSILSTEKQVPAQQSTPPDGSVPTIPEGSEGPGSPGDPEHPEGPGDGKLSNPTLPGQTPLSPFGANLSDGATNELASEPASERAKALRAVWLAGAVLTGLWFLAQNLWFYLQLRKTRERATMPDCRLPVYVSCHVKTPCLFGLNPAIYLPPNCLDKNDRTALRYILAHEETHQRHGDHLWAYLRCLCLALHWHNPFVWWAGTLSRNDCEMACDQSTLARLGEEHRRTYGHTLIDMIQPPKPSDLLSGATTMSAGMSGIKERITMIAKKPKMLWSTLVLVILFLVLAVSCTFTAPTGTEAGPPVASGDESLTNETQDEPPQPPENLFDPRKASVGDTIVGLTITDIPDIREYGWLESDFPSAIVKFKGEVTLTGRYFCESVEEQKISGHVKGHPVPHFFVDEESSASLPCIDGDMRAAHFTITNYEDALELLGSPGYDVQATIVIDDYVIRRHNSSEGGNLARLVRVVEKHGIPRASHPFAIYLPDSRGIIKIGPMLGDFPFGCDLVENSRRTYPAEGNLPSWVVTVVESDGLQAIYRSNGDPRLVKTLRANKQGYAAGDVAVGDTEESLLTLWPDKPKRMDKISPDDEAWFGADYDYAYCYIEGESTKSPRSLVYIIRDGLVSGIKVLDGLEGAVEPAGTDGEPISPQSSRFSVSTGNIHDYMPRLLAGEDVSDHELLPCLENFTLATWSELHKAYDKQDPEMPGGHWSNVLFPALEDAAVSPYPEDSEDQALRNYYIGKAFLASDGAYSEGLAPFLVDQWTANPVLYSSSSNRFFSTEEAELLRQSIALTIRYWHDVRNSDDSQFGIVKPIEENRAYPGGLYLIAYPLDFPFCFDLPEKSRETFRTESFGQVTVVESDDFQVTYLNPVDGVYRIITLRAKDRPYRAAGVAIGDSEESLLARFGPDKLRKLDSISYDDEAWFGAEYDYAYAYTQKDGTRSLVFIIRNGLVSGIEIVDGLDGPMY
jgi:beta-lactamase regulating signal transducer with metallopeptidase domain